MHVDDETLSALLDDQLPPSEAAAARRHLDACEACQQRYLELEQVVTTACACLPEIEPPRAFTIGPRALEPTPRVRRLEAWYDWSRAVTSALAAVFVLLLGARLYLGSTPAQPALVTALRSRGRRSTCPGWRRAAGRARGTADAAPQRRRPLPGSPRLGWPARPPQPPLPRPPRPRQHRRQRPHQRQACYRRRDGSPLASSFS